MIRHRPPSKLSGGVACHSLLKFERIGWTRLLNMSKMIIANTPTQGVSGVNTVKSIYHEVKPYIEKYAWTKSQ